MEEVEDSSEGSDEDMYTGSQIVRRPPPTVSNILKMCKEWISNLLNWKQFLTEEAKELNIPKAKLEDWLLKVSSLYSMTNTLLWFQKMSADEKERSKPILILVQAEIPKNDSTAYQESTFWVSANNMSNFQTNMKSDLFEICTLMHRNRDFMHKHVFKN